MSQIGSLSRKALGLSTFAAQAEPEATFATGSICAFEAGRYYCMGADFRLEWSKER